MKKKKQRKKYSYIDRDYEFFIHQCISCLFVCLFLHCWFTTYFSKGFKAHFFGTNSG